MIFLGGNWHEDLQCESLKNSVADPWNFGTNPDADPYLWLMDPDLYPDADPDPVIFVSKLQGVKKKKNFQSFFAYNFLKVHLHHFSKIKKS